MNTVLTCLSVLLLATAGCEKEKTVRSAKPATTARTQAANARMASGVPAGKSWQLPKGVMLKGIHGGNCEMPEAHSYGMTYARVALCVSLHNSSSSAITVTLPAGLVFVAASANVKNGLVPRPITFTVPAGEDLHVRIGALCMNPGREMPQGDDHYSIGPVYDQAPLKAFYSLFNRKRIYENDPRRDFDAAIIAQSLFWKLCDSTGLTKDDIALANSLADL
ncbi:hypothetical protein MKQ68_08075 [Chitinophaga horti]|uniref:Uncharacterized protein n=1 Tax=Chitinophaga horti TaxID=2920382 RepID=A0ABY6J6B6_9BACT|nr:hypothetical protein [Chitinophaga horti]UYQ95050.1 hypothetical protein MKQ68_08075 [Chitinophaga horti]